MDYNLINDEDIIRDLAKRIDRIRIEHHLKETEIEKTTGINRKTLYNFKQGAGISLKNFIQLLRAMGELERLEWMFPESKNFSPLAADKAEPPRRVRDKEKSDGDFKWGDEK